MLGELPTFELFLEASNDLREWHKLGPIQPVHGQMVLDSLISQPLSFYRLVGY
jgi:hypothetical protein